MVGRVGALVVVDDDDQRAVLGGGDVVQRLPGHAAGERAVADDRDDVVVAAQHLVGLGEAVGPAEHGGGVAVLDDVVLGLGPRGVAGEAALALAAWRSPAAGEQLVHVALVAGVPEDLVLRASRRPGAGRWSARPRRGWARGGRRSWRPPDQELPDLLRRVRRAFLPGQRLQIVRAPDVLQHRHARAPSSGVSPPARRARDDLQAAAAADSSDSRIWIPTLTSSTGGARERDPDGVADPLAESSAPKATADLIVPWNAGPASVTPRCSG